MAEGPDCWKDESIFEWDETSQLYFHARSLSILESGFLSVFFFDFLVLSSLFCVVVI